MQFFILHSVLFSLAITAANSPSKSKPSHEQLVISAASTQAYAAHVVAACRGFVVNIKELDNKIKNIGISTVDQQSDLYKKELSKWLKEHLDDEVLCAYDYIYHGPSGIEDRLFLMSDDEVGRAALVQAQNSGRTAAVNFALAANGGHSCDLQVDQRELDLNLTKDGMDSRLISMLQGGAVPTREAENSPDFKRQRQAWKDTLDGVSKLRLTTLQYCQSIYDHFGPDGDIYRNVISKPEIPYNPYQIR